MAATTFTRQVDWNTNPELAQIRFHYQGLREQINRASAVAMALGTLQPRDTHAHHLGELLDEMLGHAKHLHALDDYFEVNNYGEVVEVSDD